jgi:long-subunit acyl-CoA synthetase (AMP-forming)
MGALLVGAIPISIYASSSMPQLQQIAENAEPSILVSERCFADRARELMRACPGVKHLVLIEADATRAGELSLAEVEARSPAGFDVSAAAANVRGSDLCTLVYTSGTTGAPKGVQFTHGGVLINVASFKQRVPVRDHERVISYLPAAHVAERIFSYYAAVVDGFEITVVPDLARVPDALREVRPTRLLSVPRIYEKLLAAAHRLVDESPDRARLQAAWDAQLARIRGSLPVEDPGVDRETLRPVRESTGLQEAHIVMVAGAPSSLQMLEEWHALGIALNESYGLSETIIASVNPREHLRLGTVGTLIPSIEMRVLDDGELLLRGPTVTPGYYRDPQRTAEAFDDDGWFRTGDIVKADQDGYLRIVDRKKALIINSAGKNMSPANIERAVKSGEPLIAHVFAAGDRRPYNVGLVVLDPDALTTTAAALGLGDADFAALTRRPEIIALVRAAVDRGNEQLSRIEQLKRFAILDHEWVPGGAELTPTAKPKRREIAARYADQIAALYD